MGCKGSKHSSNLSPKSTTEDELGEKLSGTTALAFFNKEGIVVGVDSRSSNETNDIDELGKELKIQDDTIKAYIVSPKIIAIQVGTRYDCRQLILHLGTRFQSCDEFNYYDDAGDGPRVSDVVETVYKYLVGIRGRNKKFGLLIAGWDAEGHNQIYRVFIAEDDVVKQKISAAFGALGTGQSIASAILGEEGGRCYNMSGDKAADLARKALFYATLEDKSSGGPSRVYFVGQFGNRTEPIQDPFEAYSKDYSVSLEERTLFLIVISPQYISPIPARELVQHYSQEDITVLAAHCVAHRVLKKHAQRLSFHRLIFKSSVDASKAYKITAAHHRTDSELVSKFPKQLLLRTVYPGVELYLNRSSKDLLKFISKQFNGYLT